jgi:tetratricopeptide (TPR) repeat protein
MARSSGTTKQDVEAAGTPVSNSDEKPSGDVSVSSEKHARSKLADASELVPGWLALLVLVLLLAVSALGGYLVRGALIDDKPSTPTEFAVQNLEKEVEVDPNNPENQLALGYAYQQEGRYDDALKQYDLVLQTQPDNTGALYNKGVVLMTTGKTKDGEAVLWDLLEVAPDHVLAAKALGEYYVSKKHYKSALTALEPVIKLQPQYADLQYLAGYSCEQLGINDTAITYYKGALTYNPDHAEAKAGLARLGAQ